MAALVGYGSLAELFSDKALTSQIRSAILAASCWVHYRHWYKTHGWPWRLASITDRRCSEDDRAVVEHSLLTLAKSGRQCCLGHFASAVAAQLLKPDAAGLFSPQWLRLCKIGGSSIGFPEPRVLGVCNMSNMCVYVEYVEYVCACVYSSPVLLITVCWRVSLSLPTTTTMATVASVVVEVAFALTRV